MKVNGQLFEIEDLEILQTIGKGKTCVVQAAKLPNIDRIFALKQFKNSASASTDIRNETTALQALRHPNIIQLLAYDKKNLVLEYLPNGELFDMIAMRNMPEIIAKFFFSQLLSAVSHAHKNGFAHRDIKLENILIGNDYSLKLADFGFAGKIHESKKFERVLGTEGYMAPEIQMNLKYDGKNVDVFSLGVVLFSMVNGIPPFFKAIKTDPYFRYFFEGKPQTYWNLLQDKYNQTLSDSFKDLINRMFSINPEERITIAEIQSHPWMTEEISCSAEEAKNFIKEVLEQDE